jgi:hypothetical protein
VRLSSYSCVVYLFYHALYHCSILLIFIDVYRRKFIATLVTLDLTSPAMGIVWLLYKPMLVATVVRPELQVWALKATSSSGNRLLMVNHIVLFLKPCIVLRRHFQSRSLRDKTSPHHLASPAAAVVPNYVIISKDYKLLSMKVTLHSHHTPVTPSQ